VEAAAEAGVEAAAAAKMEEAAEVEAEEEVAGVTVGSGDGDSG
jgi:hypothetical protein